MNIENRIRRLEEKLGRVSHTVIFLKTAPHAEGQRETGVPHPKGKDSPTAVRK